MAGPQYAVTPVKRMTPEQKKINAQKRLASDVGLVAASTGIAAAGLKGASLVGGKKLKPWAKTADKAATHTGVASGVAGGTSGAAWALIARRDLKQQSKQKKALYELNVVKPNLKKKTVSKRDIRQRRETRNKVIPIATGAAAATTAGVTGGLLGASKYQGRQVKKLVKPLSESNAKLKSARTAQVKPRKRPLSGAAKASNDGRVDRHLKESAGLGRKMLKHKSRAVKLNPIRNGKVGIALGATTAGLAATSAVTHRNNKKGASRSRYHWWQG